MSEPTPLSSDEESQAREWFPRIASESDHVWLLQRNRTLQIIKAMWATIDALTTENATLKAALESIVSIGRLENYADLLASGERITFSPELRETMKLPGSRARAAMEGQRG